VTRDMRLETPALWGVSWLVLFGYFNQAGSDRQGMWHAGGDGKFRQGFAEETREGPIWKT
jgi:hypothetical protein